MSSPPGFGKLHCTVTAAVREEVQEDRGVCVRGSKSGYELYSWTEALLLCVVGSVEHVAYDRVDEEDLRIWVEGAVGFDVFCGVFGEGAEPGAEDNEVGGLIAVAVAVVGGGRWFEWCEGWSVECDGVGLADLVVGGWWVGGVHFDGRLYDV